VTWSEMPRSELLLRWALLGTWVFCHDNRCRQKCSSSIQP